MGNDLDDKELRKLKGQLHAIAYGLEDRVRKSDATLTAEGKLLDMGESHTVEIALALTVLGYVVSGAWLAILFILGAKALWDHYGKKTKAHPLLKQIATEFHYYVVTAATAAILFEWQGYQAPNVPITATDAVRAMLGV